VGFCVIFLTVLPRERGGKRKGELEMKKTMVVVLAMLFLGTAAGVQAANVTFNPGSVTLDVEPGNSGVAKLLVNGSSSSRYYAIKLQLGSTVAQGNLPQGWLKPADVSLMTLLGGATSATTDLVVNVPEGTPGGTYSAVVKPQVLQASEQVVASDITVSVVVPSQVSCTGVPALTNVKVGPSNIWAPTEKDVDIDISGTVVVDTGCKVSGTYAMDSNGGPVSGNLDIDETGNFALKIPIKVAKDAKAKEGTVYNGMLSVVDELGNKTSQEFKVQVDHDRGK